MSRAYDREYQVFRETGGSLSREDLNLLLLESGLNDVAERTYGHFKKLWRDGLVNYLSTNAYDQHKKKRLARERARRKREELWSAGDVPFPPLKRITIESVRSIRAATLDCSRINVFVGANGSGKSAILEAIGLIAAVAGGRVDVGTFRSAGMRLGGPQQYLSRLAGSGDSARVMVEAGTRGEFEYEVTLGLGAAKGWTVLAEALRHDGNAVVSRSLDAPGEATVNLGGEKDASSIFPPDDSGCALSAIPKKYVPPELRGLLEGLRRYAIYQPSTDVLRAVAPDERPAQPLGLSGGSLADAVEVLLDIDDQTYGGVPLSDMARLLEWASEPAMIKRTDDVLHPAVPSPEMTLAFRDRFLPPESSMISAYDASEGALHILFLFALAVHPGVAPLFSLEHADLAFNPRLVREVLSLFFRELIRRESSRQIFMTTHNPLVLDALPLDPEHVSLFAVDRTNRGSTVVRRIPFDEDLKRLIDSGLPLSELWVTGGMGGVPKL